MDAIPLAIDGYLDAVPVPGDTAGTACTGPPTTLPRKRSGSVTGDLFIAHTLALSPLLRDRGRTAWGRDPGSSRDSEGVRQTAPPSRLRMVRGHEALDQGARDVSPVGACVDATHAITP